ncbi:RsmB/NOP family class I SAM-dependent RNA methyltransferase [Pyrofollis japonicus]|uniref:RsmB/NOP family class I SAM-dependent RNA methyltransferase n=1 Tax=Pyrofollis japonicus TaxID=3060460 RepID=UPI00295BD883|nr:RsmB/NOP family class I SAM-dependent RNA methyltransferase [Pyrofollis japonicus]BEP18601.1 RsmB/NOP family class I SAM-dependent RNA methyltransferase [Pyrofollis japonicus]
MVLRVERVHAKALIEALELSEHYKPFQEVKRRVFKKYGLLGSKYDRVFTALMYRLYRLQGILDRTIAERIGINPSRKPSAIRQALRLSVVLAQFDEAGDEDFNERLLYFISRFLSKRFGVEEADNVIKLYKGLRSNPWRPRNRREELEYKYSMPWILIDALRRLLSWNEIEEFAKSINTRNPLLGFRVNTLKARLEEVLSELQSLGVEAWPSERVPNHIRYRGSLDYQKFRGLREGKVVPQDEASAAAGYLLGARPGETIYDLCAAPGGKTTHLAELAHNLALVVAMDIRHDRLLRLRELALRTGTHSSIHIVAGDARKASLLLRGRADRVLLDPPCTSTGSLAKYPEARWRLSEKTIKDHVAKQRAMLLEAAKLLKPGGRLLYTVCSILPEEGERNIEWFLANVKGFELVPLEDPYEASPLLPGTMRSWPHRHDTSGFFYALLEKKKEV